MYLEVFAHICNPSYPINDTKSILFPLWCTLPLIVEVFAEAHICAMTLTVTKEGATSQSFSFYLLDHLVTPFQKPLSSSLRILSKSTKIIKSSANSSLEGV